MDSQGCFSPPLTGSLANQPTSVLATGFPSRYPHLVYDMANDKEVFPTIRYQNTIRKSGEDAEPADLSMTRNDVTQPSNTRLLREILQGKKQLDDEELVGEAEDKEYVVSSPASVYVDGDDSGEDEDGGNKRDEQEGGEERHSGGGVIRQTGSLLVENHIPPMRVPSNGAASENSEPSSTGSRKGKRKQIYPQQVDGVTGAGPDKDGMRQQLNIIQEQINVFQERYSSMFSDGSHAVQRNGQKRKLDDDDHLVDDIDPATVNGTLSPFGQGGGRRLNEQLVALISTEIHEKISPIVASVINKYLHQPSSPAKNDQSAPGLQQPQQQPPRARSKTASPVQISRGETNQIRYPTPVPNKKPLEKPKQPLNVNNDVQAAGKNFGPHMYRSFPGHAFFGNENKLANDFVSMSQLAAMAGAAPTMYNPNFHPLRPSFFPAEQTEAIPLVVSQKKKRHKVTDTRITPRVMSKMICQKEDSQDGRKFPSSPGPMNNTMLAFNGNGMPFLTRSIDMHGLHSEFSAFHPSGMDNGRFGLATPPFFNRSNVGERRETSSPLGGSAGSPSENDDASLGGTSDMGSTDMSVGGGRPPRDFSQTDSMNYPLSSTLTPMHLRKAKLMFFFTRYPNSATLKTFFPDIKFNKNNTAQLVKWFSNFREFYYIQMEKFAKQALAEGIKDAEQIEVAKDSELYRLLNLHYNRNNHIDVPDAFRDVVEATLQEFFKALQAHRDQEPSWKKAIYKVINRMDDTIPDYFRLPHFLEQLE